MKIHQNIAVRLMGHQFDQVAHLKEIGCKFFFDESSIPCYSYGLLDTMINLGVSDIYIYDNLCYHMKHIKEKCEKNNIRTRLTINTIPSVSPDRGEDCKAPVYCPRDADIIEQYIDTIEFDCWEDGKYN